MRHKGTAGGTYRVANFAMAKYPIANAQYQRFIDAPTGHANSDQYPRGQSPYGVMDMVGNLAEWLLTRWGEDSVDVNGYSYRGTRGSAWNVATSEYLRANDRNGWSPRGRLNDAGFSGAYYGA